MPTFYELPVLTATGDFANAGDNILVAAPGGDSEIELLWIYVQAVGAVAEGTVLVIVRLGPDEVYKFELTGSQPFSHRTKKQAQRSSDALIINTSNASRVLADADYRTSP